MDDFLLRLVMFLLGAVMVGGGLTFTFQSLNGQRSAFQAAIFGITAVIIGLYLCVWTFTGPPG
jgi:hypothetical protein